MDESPNSPFLRDRGPRGIGLEGGGEIVGRVDLMAEGISRAEPRNLGIRNRDFRN